MFFTVYSFNWPKIICWGNYSEYCTIVWTFHRAKSLRSGEVQLLRAMRDQSTRDRQLRMRPRMWAGDEARVRPWRDHLHVHVRAEEAGVPDKEQHRGRIRRHVRLQRTLFWEGQSQLFACATRREVTFARSRDIRFRARRYLSINRVSRKSRIIALLVH